MNVRSVEVGARHPDHQDYNTQRRHLLPPVDVGQEPEQQFSAFTLRHGDIVLLAAGW
jgi:hypothetical protein